MDKRIYDNLKKAYDHFNKHLFDNSLPNNVIVTVQSSTAFKGYYAENKYQKLGGSEFMHEICLNSVVFDKGDEAILSTLVHEMAHLWHSEYGTPGKWGYHTADWGNKMIEVGLNPICEGVVGKKYGKSCTHEIIEGGAFDKICNILVSTNQLFYFHDRGFTINETTGKITKPGGKPKGLNSKVTYKCYNCNITVYGKQYLNIICGECGQRFQEKEK